jgi:aspartyl-tRNA(Asn)/glutamyl-tRNA(Gln) amidotransferase subunit B
VLAGADPALRAVFDEAAGAGADPQAAALWVTGEVTGWLRREEIEPAATSLSGSQLAELLEMISSGALSSSAAKDVLDGVMRNEGTPSEVASARDLLQISDVGALEAAVSEVLDANPDAVDRYRGGEQKVVGFLVGQVMRATQGKADPKLVNQLLRERLS